MAASLFACGDSGGKSGGGDKKITFWSVFTGGDGAAMQKIVDACNAANPEYEV